MPPDWMSLGEKGALVYIYTEAEKRIWRIQASRTGKNGEKRKQFRSMHTSFYFVVIYAKT